MSISGLSSAVKNVLKNVGRSFKKVFKVGHEPVDDLS
jgi:hypothetical protein